MPVVMNMRWKGVTKEQYEAALKEVRWETDIPKGAKFHVSAFDDQGLLVTDVWDSAEDFNNFVEQRLGPGVQKVGIKGDPDVTISPAHRIFAPNPA